MVNNFPKVILNFRLFSFCTITKFYFKIQSRSFFLNLLPSSSQPSFYEKVWLMPQIATPTKLFI